MCTVLVLGKRCRQYNCEQCFKGKCFREWPDTGDYESTEYDIDTWRAYRRKVFAAVAASWNGWNCSMETESEGEPDMDEDENAVDSEGKFEGKQEQKDSEEQVEDGIAMDVQNNTLLVKRLSKWATWVFFNGSEAGIHSIVCDDGIYWLNAQELVRVARYAHNRKNRHMFSELDAPSMINLLSIHDEGRWKADGNWITRLNKGAPLYGTDGKGKGRPMIWHKRRRRSW